MKVKSGLRALILFIFAITVLVWNFFSIDYATTLPFEGQLITIKRGDNNIP